MSIKKGKSKYTTAYIKDNFGDYPIYSSNTNEKTKGLMGKINGYDWDMESIQFTANGEKAGTIFKLDKHKFAMNGDRGLFMILKDDLYLAFIYYSLKKEFLKHEFSWANKPTNTKIRDKIKISIPMPLASYTSFDIQKIIADFISEIDNELQKTFNKLNQAYLGIERYKKTYLLRTFSLIDWSK